MDHKISNRPLARKIVKDALGLIIVGWCQRMSAGHLDPGTGIMNPPAWFAPDPDCPDIAFPVATHYCLTGALHFSALHLFHTTEPTAVLVLDEICDELVYRLDTHDGGLIDWNDTEGRTQDQVIGLLYTLLDDLETPEMMSK